MAKVVGLVEVLQSEQKEYEGRKYFKVTSLSDDNEVFFWSCNDDIPKIGETWQQILYSRDGKPALKYMREK